MKKIIFMCAAIVFATAINAASGITIKDVTSGVYNAERISGINPLRGGTAYTQISQDGKRIERYAFATGKLTGVLFDMDKALLRLKDMDGYEISPDGKRLLIYNNSHRIYRRSFTADFYLYNSDDQTMVPLSTGGAQQIPTFSPDSRLVAFVRGNNIFITDGKTERQITTDGEFNKIINGLPDWVNEEEFSFNNALAWGADSKTLSWIRYDETHVKTYSLQLFKGAKPTREEYDDYPGLYSYKYPKAGQENSRVSVLSYNLATGKTIGMDLPLDSDGYIPRVVSTALDRCVLIYTMNRHQSLLNIYRADPTTGECNLIIKEQNDKYVKEEVLEGICLTKKHLLLPSDRDGYMHLYLYDLNGKLLRQIESGQHEVSAVYGYDERTGNTYYQAAGIHPTQREVYVTDSKGRTSCLTTRHGWNSAIFSADYRCFINVWSDRNTPYIYSAVDNKGRTLRTIVDNHELAAKLKDAGRCPVDTFSFVTSEGVRLNGVMIKPANFDPAKRYPVVMWQYSGPGSQQVVDAWNIGSMGGGAMYDSYFAQQGFIVVCVDGRGTGGRGADFEKCTYLHIGELEARDQVEAALWLGRQSYVDSTRIGIWGWSYGGFCTLMSMSEGRPAFKAGVAVAPPTNWKYYDSVYTERYMRTPQENGTGYAINPIGRADKLHGALLICHGMADDNVHPQNTFEYAEALVQHDKDFREIYYTNRNHSIYGGNTRNHLLRQVADWLIEELK